MTISNFFQFRVKLLNKANIVFPCMRFCFFYSSKVKTESVTRVTLLVKEAIMQTNTTLFLTKHILWYQEVQNHQELCIFLGSHWCPSYCSTCKILHYKILSLSFIIIICYFYIHFIFSFIFALLSFQKIVSSSILFIHPFFGVLRTSADQ